MHQTREAKRYSINHFEFNGNVVWNIQQYFKTHFRKYRRLLVCGLPCTVTMIRINFLVLFETRALSRSSKSAPQRETTLPSCSLTGWLASLDNYVGEFSVWRSCALSAQRYVQTVCGQSTCLLGFRAVSQWKVSTIHGFLEHVGGRQKKHHWRNSRTQRLEQPHRGAHQVSLAHSQKPCLADSSAGVMTPVKKKLSNWRIPAQRAGKVRCATS